MRVCKRLFSAVLVGWLSLSVWLGFGIWLEAIAVPSPDASPTAALFEANCAACHANGGNLIRRGKNLKQKALSRYGYDSAEAIESLVTQGKGAMPAYADRLSKEEVEAIAQYVLTQAESGW